MWTCSEIKKEGWDKLQKSLGPAILITLIFIILSGIFTGTQQAISTLKTIIQYDGDWRSIFNESQLQTLNTSPQVLLLSLLQGGVRFLSLIAAFLLVNPLGVGYTRWFLTNRETEEPAPFNLLFSPFRTGSYGGIVAGTAWVTLWTYLWSLVAGLCFVPLYGVMVAAVISIVFSAGIYTDSSVSMNQDALLHNFLNVGTGLIIAFVLLLILGTAGYLAITLNRKYAYFFTNYILAENPNFGAKNALDLSKRMTTGMKGRLFLLDLSFIGWWLLSMLTCGILALGVMPYTYSAYTEVYLSRKKELHI